MDVHVRNPLMPEIDAAVIVADFTFDMDVEIDKHWLLKGDVDSIDVTVKKMDLYFNSKASIKSVNKDMTTFGGLMIAYFNMELS